MNLLKRSCSRSIRNKNVPPPPSFLLLILILLAFLCQTSLAFAKGSKVTSVKWSKRVIDTTVKRKISDVKVRVKDKTPLATVRVKVERNKKHYYYFSLTLTNGSNRNGIWRTEKMPWFASEKGTWKVTEVITVNQDGYVYALRKPKGIGQKLKVKVGPKSKITLSAPSSAYAGSKVKITAKVTVKKKAIKKKPVFIYVGWTNLAGTWKTSKYKVKTNKKGKASKTITMPGTNGEVYVSAEFKGLSKKAQPSWTQKTIKRKIDQASISLSAPTQVRQGAVFQVAATLRFAGKARAGKKITFALAWYNPNGQIQRARYVVNANASGVAARTLTMPQTSGRLEVTALYTTTNVRESSASVTKVVAQAYLPATLSAPTTSWDRKPGKTAAFTTRLTYNGTPLVNKTVHFNFYTYDWYDDEWYWDDSESVTTDSSGYATVSYYVSSSYYDDALRVRVSMNDGVYSAGNATDYMYVSSLESAPTPETSVPQDAPLLQELKAPKAKSPGVDTIKTPDSVETTEPLTRSALSAETVLSE